MFWKKQNNLYRGISVVRIEKGDWSFSMYVTDGKHIRKVKMWRDNMGYKYASVRIGLFKKVITWGYYSDPATTLLTKIQSLGWKRIEIESPFKRFLKFLKGGNNEH